VADAARGMLAFRHKQRCVFTQPLWSRGRRGANSGGRRPVQVLVGEGHDLGTGALFREVAIARSAWSTASSPPIRTPITVHPTSVRSSLSWSRSCCAGALWPPPYLPGEFSSTAIRPCGSRMWGSTMLEPVEIAGHASCVGVLGSGDLKCSDSAPPAVGPRLSTGRGAAGAEHPASIDVGAGRLDLEAQRVSWFTNIPDWCLTTCRKGVSGHRGPLDLEIGFGHRRACA
jgi:hypothetical protein